MSTVERPWISYTRFFSFAPVLSVWQRTFCQLGVHLFDEVEAFIPGPGEIALVESMTGLRAEVAPDITIDVPNFLVCDACGLEVPVVEAGLIPDP